MKQNNINTDRTAGTEASLRCPLAADVSWLAGFLLDNETNCFYFGESIRSFACARFMKRLLTPR